MSQNGGTFKVTDLEDIIKKFEDSRKPNHRYASFDCCYNYFYKTENLEEDIEKSCLELASYLASWGMLRNSFLLQRSIKHFQKTIEYINSLDNTVWKIDVDNYTETNMDKILEIRDEICNELNSSRTKEDSSVTTTLVTKIMLGVFGFVPAYDRLFRETFRNITNGECGFTSFNKKSLTVIKRFYDDNKELINKLSRETFTYDFGSGAKTQIPYTKAKIIDMYGFEYSFGKK